MAATPKLLFQAAIGTTLSTVYTVPASPTYAELLAVTFTNTTTSAIKVRVHLVPSAGTASTSNALVYDWSLDTQGLPYTVFPKQVLPSGMTIQVVATAAGVTVTGSGLEVS